MNCPICGENTRRATKTRPERCPVKTCPAQHIERNNRGWAWVWDNNGRLVHKPNRHPLPVDIHPGRAMPRAGDDTPLPDHSHDAALLARMFGTTGMSVKTKENTP